MGLLAMVVTIFLGQPDASGYSIPKLVFSIILIPFKKMMIDIISQNIYNLCKRFRKRLHSWCMGE